MVKSNFQVQYLKFLKELQLLKVKLKREKNIGRMLNQTIEKYFLRMERLGML